MSSAYDLYAASHTQAQVAEVVGCTTRTVRSWKTRGVPAYVERLFEEKLSERSRNAEFTFVDLFAGIGGTRQAFEKANGRCVFTSEWDKRAVATYTENFRETEDHVFAGDITQVNAEEIPDHDVLVAGFPCQPFSIAGVSKKNSLGRPTGFEDPTQGTLFFDVARILEEKQPRAFMLENVRNLRSHDKGRTFKIIMETLDRLDYDVYEEVIGAEPWVPQKRYRIFIVGFKRGTHTGTFSFNRLKVPHSVRPTVSNILHPEDGSEAVELPYTQGDGEVAEKYTLSDKLWTYLQGYAEKHRRAGNGFGFGLVGPGDVARTLSARYYKDGSEILVTRPEGNPRRLTPRECARLMGFPDSFKIPVSDTAAYQQFGNSVVVPLVAAVAELIRAELEAQNTQSTRPVERIRHTVTASPQPLF